MRKREDDLRFYYLSLSHFFFFFSHFSFSSSFFFWPCCTPDGVDAAGLAQLGVRGHAGLHQPAQHAHVALLRCNVDGQPALLVRLQGIGPARQQERSHLLKAVLRAHIPEEEEEEKNGKKTGGA
jgi:hypothetical protein